MIKTSRLNLNLSILSILPPVAVLVCSNCRFTPP